MGRYRLLLAISFMLILSGQILAQVKLKTVVIDAGHGGKDPGAIGVSKTYEKDIALVVALKLGDYISKLHPDVNVVYTRKTDVFLELHERAEIANKNKADLFIAIHVNSSTNSDAYGTSSYVLGLHRTEANLEVAKRENAVISLEDNVDKHYDFDPNSPEGHIIMSMKQNAFLDQSIDIASKVENQFENYARRKSLGVKQAGFYVLYKTTMPSILAEIGFMSNAEEEKYLNSVKGQDLIATALYNAFKDYKTELEGSEGAQYAYEQALQAQSKETASNATSGNTATNTKTTSTSATQPAIEKPASTTKSENSEPVKPATNDSEVKIRIPVEQSAGGGTTVSAGAKVNDVEPVMVKGVTKTDPFDTTSMSALNNGGSSATKSTATTKTTTTPPKKPETPAVVKTEVAVEAKSDVEPKTTSAAGKTALVPNHVAESGTVFKIQLFALKGELKDYDKISKLFSTLSAEVLPNGFVRYYGGNVKTAAQAKTLLDKAKSAGYPEAFVAGFKDGKRMSTDDLKSLGL